MSRYVQVNTADGNQILIEVDSEKEVIQESQEETPPQEGVERAGAKEKLKKAVSAIQSTFEEAIEQVMKANAQTFLNAARRLPEPPAKVELTFGLKATGEGNVAVAKIGGEANYTIKLEWNL